MSMDDIPSWSPDPAIASLIRQERDDTRAGARATTDRMWHRLEMYAIGAAATAEGVTAAVRTGAAATEAARNALGPAAVATAPAQALAWKMGAASALLLAGGAMGALLQARTAPVPRVIAPPSVVAQSSRTTELPTAPALEQAPEGALSAIDVDSLPRVPARAPSFASRPAPVPGAALAAGPAASPSVGATSLGEEQRLLDTARAAVARGAYGPAIASLTEHETRFPSGRLTEERELLFVQALAGVGSTTAADARARAFAERFPRSIFLPAIRALSTTQGR